MGIVCFVLHGLVVFMSSYNYLRLCLSVNVIILLSNVKSFVKLALLYTESLTILILCPANL